MAITMFQGKDYHSISWNTKATDTEVAVIHLLCIDPNYHRQGIGKKLVQEGIALAKKEQKKQFAWMH